MINLLLTDQQRMLEVLKAVRNSFEFLVLMAVPDHKNTISFALKQPPAEKEVLMTRVLQLQDVLDLNFLSYLGACRVWPIVAREIRIEANFSIFRGE